MPETESPAGRTRDEGGLPAARRNCCCVSEVFGGGGNDVQEDSPEVNTRAVGRRKSLAFTGNNNTAHTQENSNSRTERRERRRATAGNASEEGSLAGGGIGLQIAAARVRELLIARVKETGGDIDPDPLINFEIFTLRPLHDILITIRYKIYQITPLGF